MIKGYKYRIYPNEKQREYFKKVFGCVRYIYNWGLETKIKAYEKDKTNISCFELINELPKLKITNIWLREVGADSLQQALRYLDSAYKKFFKENRGFPVFKSKKNNKNSFKTHCVTYIDFNKNTLQIPKCKNIKVKIDRVFEGRFTGCTISKTSTDKYYVSFNVEDGREISIKPKPIQSKTIGIDLGLKSFAVMSDGKVIENPKFYRKTERKLKILNRRLSKKRKGSSNRNKARLKLTRYYEKVSNQRNDFLHKLSSRLVAENQSIAIEDLAVSNMLKNHNLSKSISDVAWSEFRRQLTYKCNWYGKNLLVIDHFCPSSKMCSCGVINKNLKLSDREWTCKSCNITHDRDLLAAQNIVKFAFIPQGMGNFKPVEFTALAGTMKQEYINLI